MISLAVIGIMNSLAIAAAFLRNSGKKRIADKLSAVIFILIAIRLGKVIAQGSDFHLVQSIYFNLMHAVFLALGPTLLFYSRSIGNQKFGLTRANYIHLLPALFMMLLASFIRSNISEVYWLRVYEGILLFPVPYLALSMRNTFRNRNLLRSPFWTISVVAFVALVVIMNWLFYWVDFPFYVVTAVLVTGLLYLLVLRLIQSSSLRDHSAKPKTTLNPVFVQRGFDEFETFISQQKNYQNAELNLQTVADQLGIPRHQLSKIIKSSGNQTFPEYLNTVRVEAAKTQLLAEPDSKIAAIAFDNGFQSISSFNASFKAKTGLTPTAYRTQNLS